MTHVLNGVEWITETITRQVIEAPENRLLDFEGQAIFDTPLVGVADGDDPLFEEFRAAVGPRHLLPREVLRRYAPLDMDLTQVRVIAWALPFTDPIRRSNRGRRWPSRLYSLARNNGGALNDLVRRRAADTLRAQGGVAVAPVLTGEYDAFRSEVHTFASSWSERHVAYAAGLGRFGLNGTLIRRRRQKSAVRPRDELPFRQWESNSSTEAACERIAGVSDGSIDRKRRKKHGDSCHGAVFS